MNKAEIIFLTHIWEYLGVCLGFQFVESLHATRFLGVQSVLLAFSIARPVSFFLPHPGDFLVLAVLFLV